jgi:hypothetical protein
MTKKLAATDESFIESLILTVRGVKVILDADLATLYGVKTKALNQAVKRNADRFPSDFVFRLTPGEAEGVRHTSSQSVIVNASDNRSQLVTGSQKHRDPRYLPRAFTEHGAIMAANVLNSPRAVQMSVFVVRAFVRMRATLTETRQLARRLDELERRYSAQFKVVFDAIRELMAPAAARRRRIGFRVEEARPPYRLRRLRPAPGR